MKISSEEAGYVALTPVVARDMPLRELLAMLLGVAGKDTRRIRDVLLRGTFVSGASRFRWSGFEATGEDLAALLASFPDPGPARRFAPSACARVVLRGRGLELELTSDAASRRRFLRRRSYWDVLMEAAAASAPRYIDYSHTAAADRYAAEVSPETAFRLRASASLLRYRVLEAQLRRAEVTSIEFLIPR